MRWAHPPGHGKALLELNPDTPQIASKGHADGHPGRPHHPVRREVRTMAVLLMLGLLAVFGGFWLFFAALWLMFRLTFWIVGGLVGLVVGGVGLMVMGLLGLVLLPVAALLALLFVGGLVWLVVHLTRPQPLIIRR